MLQALDPKAKYIIAEFPHGTYPMGPFLGGTMIPRLFPGRRVLSVGASVLFKIPLYKHIMTWMGCQPADRKTFQRLLDKGSVAAVVGGMTFARMKARFYGTFHRKCVFARSLRTCD